jgi:crotonobetainyl-CoA:carnitine CoA-transferase CaiB-like acyl-CoA transferase
LGAEIVLVERPTGDRARALPDFFAAFARGKRSVALDLKQPDSMARLTPLIARADVVVEGFSPGTADRLGFGYEALRRINPLLVYASISGFGQTGPYRNRAAHDLSYQALAGALADQAFEPRAKPTVAIGDVSAALFAVIGILAGLQGRQKSGQGTYVDVGMTDSLVSCLVPFLAPVLNGREPLDAGKAPANNLFRTSDGRVLSLSVLQEDDFWQALCGLLGLGAHANLDFVARHERADELGAQIAARIAERPLDFWSEAFDRLRIAWSPVLTLEGVVQDLHMQARGLFDVVTDASGHAMRFIRQPLKFSNYSDAPVLRIPSLGEGNAELLAF